MLEDDCIGGHCVGETALIFPRSTPEDTRKDSPEDDVIIAKGNEISHVSVAEDA